MRLTLKIAAATAGIIFASAAFAQDIKIALIAGKTGLSKPTQSRPKPDS